MEVNPASGVQTPCLSVLSSCPPIFTYTFLGGLPYKSLTEITFLLIVLNSGQFIYSLVSKQRLWQKGNCSCLPSPGGPCYFQPWNSS